MKNTEIEYIKTLLENEKLSRFKDKVYVCGGAVRDYIMYGNNAKPKDIDFVVDLPNGGIEFAEEVCKVCNCYIEGSNPVIYNRFKTAKFKLVIDCVTYDFEVVEPRKETYSDDSRNPDVISCTLFEDASRRDLTINAMYYNVSTGLLYDPCNGKNDIMNNLLVTPLDPVQTFMDDPLRMLRLFRFKARFGYSINEETIMAVKKCASKLTIISKERIKDELVKIMSVESSSALVNTLKDMMKCDILKYIICELGKLPNMPQGVVHSYRNVWEHTLNALKNTPNDYILRLSVLLHDIGKVNTMLYNSYDDIKYPIHHIEGERIVKERLRELKFTNDEIKLISNAVLMHMSFNTIYFKYNNLLNDDITLNKEYLININNLIVDKCVDLTLCFNVFKYDVQSLDDSKRLIKDDDIDIAKNIINRITSLKSLITKNNDFINGNDVMIMHPEVKGKDIALMIQQYNNKILVDYPIVNKKYILCNSSL